MKQFHLVRMEDESGVSGTGIVGEGVVFSNGKVALTWLSGINSVLIYDSVSDLDKIHGHQGKTRVVYNEVKVLK